MTKTTTNTIQLFEQQTLRIGEKINSSEFDKHIFMALALFHEKHGGKYYTLLHNGVKFKQYVGVLKVGRYTIEILPKADKTDSGDRRKWQSILLEMLQYCHLIKPESSGEGSLSSHPNSILDVYLDLFLTGINQLIIKGLPQRYQIIESNQKVLKGQLHLPRHLRKNARHPERFYVKYHTFTQDQLYNRILLEALKILDILYLKPALKTRLKQVLAVFPHLPGQKIQNRDFEQLFVSLRKNHFLTSLIEIARLIILNFSPDIRSGHHHLLALLFDMNMLFEEYIYRQLKQMENDRLIVERQTSKPFWQRQSIRPDIVLKHKGNIFILDTKWKLLRSNTPSIEDLKQLYIYCQYFDATHGALVYPKVYSLKSTAPIPFHSTVKKNQVYKGQVIFLDILDQSGRLNKQIGQQLLDALIS